MIASDRQQCSPSSLSWSAASCLTSRPFSRPRSALDTRAHAMFRSDVSLDVWLRDAYRPICPCTLGLRGLAIFDCPPTIAGKSSTTSMASANRRPVASTACHTAAGTALTGATRARPVRNVLVFVHWRWLNLLSGLIVAQTPLLRIEL